MMETLSQLFERHVDLLSAAADAVETRKSWSPFRDSPIGKLHAP